MIGALRGKVIYRVDDSIIIDVQGVGYEVTVTTAVAEKVMVGSEQSIFVYTDVRENAIVLFGFLSHLERQVFFLLKKAKGVGSRTALNIVSTIGPEGVLTAIGQKDISRLKAVSGVGTKTAERIVLELRETVGELLDNQNIPLARSIERTAIGSSEKGGIEGDVILALEKLGFSGERARQVVSLALKQDAARDPAVAANPGELLRIALSHL